MLNKFFIVEKKGKPVRVVNLNHVKSIVVDRDGVLARYAITHDPGVDLIYKTELAELEITPEDALEAIIFFTDSKPEIAYITARKAIQHYRKTY